MDPSLLVHGMSSFSKSTPILFFALGSCSVTNLKAITTRILEKDGVVTGFSGLGNFISWSFDVPRSRTSSNPSQHLNFADAVRPERDAAFVRTVLGRLSDAEKLRDAVSVVRLKLQPPLDPDVAREAKRGQERFVKRSCLGKAAHSQVNVIIASRHGEMA